MIRAVIDTNVIVSGLLFGGIPLKVINFGLAKNFVWVTSPILMEEIERVMRNPKFGLSDREIRILTTPIFSIAEIIIPVNTLNVIERCPPDNRVLECAVEGKCSMIVTGDRRDLLSLEKFYHIQIVSPRNFLNQIF